MGRGVEEVVIVGIAAKGSSQSDGKGRDVDVEEALIWSVGRAARPKGGWAKVEEAAVGGYLSIGVDMAKVVFPMLVVGEDFVGSSLPD